MPDLSEQIVEFEFKSDMIYLVKEPLEDRERLFKAMADNLSRQAEQRKEEGGPSLMNVCVIACTPDGTVEEIPTETLERVLESRRSDASQSDS